MGKTYTEPDAGFLNIANAVLKKHHQRLVEAGVEIKWLLVHASRDKETDDPTGPALKLHGYPCRAIIKIYSLKDRAAGCADALCLVDGDDYLAWSDGELESVIDHEICHLELVVGKEGVAVDDLGRPKLTMRLHDWQLGGFEEICKRHGDKATEKKAFAATAKKYEQLLLPWG